MKQTSQSGNTTVIMAVIGLLVIGAAAVFYFTNNAPDSADSAMNAENMADDTMDTAGEEMMDDPMAADPAMDDADMAESGMAEDDMDDSAMADDPMAEDSRADSDEMMASEAYIPYSAAAATQAAQDGTAVIFFAADWCPTCQAADTAFSQQTDQIPAGVTVLKADYDTEDELKTQYGVTSQHTFVQIDENGEMVTTWSGGDISELTANIQ